MASIQKKGQSYYCQFLFLGNRHTFNLGQVHEDEARAKAQQFGYLLMRLKQRLIRLPDGTDIVTFVRFDGAPPEGATVLPERQRQDSTLGMLRDRYVATLGKGTIEANSLATILVHLSHACRVLGKEAPVGELTSRCSRPTWTGGPRTGCPPIRSARRCGRSRLP
jgi:hypothetical protein